MNDIFLFIRGKWCSYLETPQITRPANKTGLRGLYLALQDNFHLSWSQSFVDPKSSILVLDFPLFSYQSDKIQVSVGFPFDLFKNRVFMILCLIQWSILPCSISLSLDPIWFLFNYCKVYLIVIWGFFSCCQFFIRK